jgi:hypothetical protein
MNINKEIDNTVVGLKSNYDVGTIEGLKDIARDNKITVIESPKVIIPCSQYRLEQDGFVVFTRPFSDIELRLQFLAHEMGHALLRHGAPDLPIKLYEEQESEAIYFAKSLLGRSLSTTRTLREVSSLLVTRPISSLRAAYSARYRRELADSIYSGSR